MVVGSNLARGKIFTASIGSVDPSIIYNRCCKYFVNFVNIIYKYNFYIYRLYLHRLL